MVPKKFLSPSPAATAAASKLQSKSATRNSSTAAKETSEIQITPYQTSVYALLSQIPAGKVSTYAALSRALQSSPRAVGGALRRNPFAPEVPCHRVISADGYVGGFKGEWQKAPSGINTEKKLRLLEGEGVLFDEKGRLKETRRFWSEFVV